MWGLPTTMRSAWDLVIATLNLFESARKPSLCLWSSVTYSGLDLMNQRRV